MDKSQNDRLKECLSIVRKITDTLQIPADDSNVVELRSHMNTYIRTGDEWIGTVDFSKWGRIAHCNFPKASSKVVEVVLKVPLKK
jgi:hypothetical protein